MIVGSTWKANEKPSRESSFGRPRSPKTNVDPAYEKLSNLFAPAPRKPNTELPTLERRTKKPSANWSPRPQAIVLSLIALRLVENSHANPRITAMPSTPVHLPMKHPPAIVLRADDPAHQGPSFPRRIFAHDIAAGNERFSFGEFGVAIEMKGGQGLSLFHAIADALVKFEADAVINLVFLPFAAPAQHGERNAELLAVRSGDEAAGGTRYVEIQARDEQAFRLVNDALVSTLQPNSLPEFFECLAADNHGFREVTAFFHALGPLAEIKHPRGEFQAQFAQIGRAAAFQDLDGLGDLVRMAGHAA